jgi:drug/metabolite transporter (DMT)-like permease
VGASRTRSGFLLALVSASAFGVLPIFGKFAFAEGLEVTTLLAWRFSLAALVLWALAAVRPARARIPTPRRRALLALGALYSINSALYFLALERIPASMTSLVFYLYPALVTLLGVVLFKRKIRPLNLLALGLALLGVTLTVGFAPGDLDPAGIALALSAAAVVAFYFLLSELALSGLPTLYATAFVMTGTAVACWIWQALANGFAAPPSGRAWLLVGIMAVFSTALSIVAMLGAITRIGAARTAIVNTLEPAVTAMLAVVMLSETLTLRQIAGGGLILTGIVLLRLARSESHPREAPESGTVITDGPLRRTGAARCRSSES